MVRRKSTSVGWIPVCRQVLGWLTLHICLAAWATAADPAPADLVVLHARIVTMDSARPNARAMAVTGHEVVELGSDQQILRRVGPRTRVIDAQDRLVLPGFNDAHVHFLSGGKQLSGVQLRDARSPQEFSERIGQAATRLPAAAWITGGDWDHENWPGGGLPQRDWIDRVTPRHPVFVQRLDGHMALANSLALAQAGIDRETRDPDGGTIVRDASGEPTGILKDAAMNLVSRNIPQLSFEERLAAARAATEHAAEMGVTSVQDMSGDGDVLVYRELLKRGQLKTRIYAMAPLPQWEKSWARGFKAGVGDRWIRQGGLKGFADGSLGSTTALFFEPYVDAPGTRGLPSDEMFPAGAMLERLLGADRAHLQIMIHAIGDSANDQVLSLMETVTSRNGPRDRRLRIEHAQHLRREDVARFAKHQVIASMQPYHCADDGRWAEKRIGSQRAEGTYAFRWLLDAGVTLAFGSDWNVAPLDPIQGIAAAVTRRTLDGRHPDGWVPLQKISVLEAVQAYTLGSATAEFTDQSKGSLSPGKLADFVILSSDITTIDPSEISRAQVLLTVVDGQVVFERQKPSPGQ